MAEATQLANRNSRFLRYLQNQLVRGVRKNPQYSLRSFARKLDVHPSVLSQIVAGRRTLTDSICVKISERLEMPPLERDYLMGFIESRDSAHFANHIHLLDQDEFKVISDWYHYAILELTHIDSFQGDVQWISDKLGLDFETANQAVQRMVRLGYLRKDKHGWTDCLGDISNDGHIDTAEAYRKLQKQILQKAIDALDSTPYEKRIQTSMTLAVCSDRVKEAKDRCLKFVEEISDFLQAGPVHDDVFNISLSVYPLIEDVTEKNNEKEV